MTTSAISPANAPANIANTVAPRAAQAKATVGATDTDSKPPASKAVINALPSNAVIAALQEATETAAQTAKEASGGDHQAQRLLQKAAAAHGHTPSRSAVQGSIQASRSPVVNSSGQLTGTIVNTKA